MKDEIPDPMELLPVTQRELDEALARHVMYLHGEKSGARCVLQYRNLSRLNFRGGDCTQADFTASMIIDSDLSDAKFVSANFFGCDMRNANLSNANLVRADLRGAYLAGADLTVRSMPSAVKPTRRWASGTSMTRPNSKCASNRIDRMSSARR